MEQVKKAAIVLAAGHGKRMHSKVAKQYLLLNGEPVLVHALRAFEMSGRGGILQEGYRGGLWVFQRETGRAGRKRAV